jgi:trimeric autotransporter adhesin
MRGLALVLAACGSAPATTPDAADAPAYARMVNVASPYGLPSDEFGAQVALSNDGLTLAVGVPRDDSAEGGLEGIGNQAAPDAGAVYVFTFVDGSWELQAFLKPGSIDSADQFGASIGLSATGDTLLVGAPGDDGAFNETSSAGAAYVFRRHGTQWSQQAYLQAGNLDLDDGFGQAVALSSDGNTAAVGAPGEDGADDTITDSGAAYVFTTDGTRWTEQAYLKTNLPEKNADFGSALAISASGDALIVGAPRETLGSVARAGAADVFLRAAGTWTLVAQLTAQAPQTLASFGSTVAMSGLGTTVVIGAPREDGATTMASGAAYAFGGDGWAQRARVAEAAPRVSDQLGAAVAISADGRRFAAGAPTADLGGADSGAVLTFAIDGTPGPELDGVEPGAQLGNALSLDSDGHALAVGVALAGSNDQGLVFLYD